MKKTLFFLFSILTLSASAQVDITFQVDMNGVTGFTTPEVNGTFNNWCGSCAPMADADGDGVWDLTIALMPGAYEYKFSYDNWGGQETLVAGSSCTMTTGPYTNRVLNVATADSLPVVCWGSCAACGQSVGPYNITFVVDMSASGATFTTPEVNGTFNNWCGGCAPMSDANGDNVWEITIALNTGTYEYKYAFDTWAGSEALTAGDPCTVTNAGFTNRILDVTDNVVMDTVCYGSCISCGGINVNEITAEGFSIYPNPVQNSFMIQSEKLVKSIAILDNTGKKIELPIVALNNNVQVNTESLPTGIYHVQVITANGASTQRFVKL
ncbi:MAG: hypothetical protein RLZZ155_1113 [Bacteroidota bacterium]|jgi:hypothetical protein